MKKYEEIIAFIIEIVLLTSLLFLVFSGPVFSAFPFELNLIIKSFIGFASCFITIYGVFLSKRLKRISHYVFRDTKVNFLKYISLLSLLQISFFLVSTIGVQTIFSTVISFAFIFSVVIFPIEALKGFFKTTKLEKART